MLIIKLAINSNTSQVLEHPPLTSILSSNADLISSFARPRKTGRQQSGNVQPAYNLAIIGNDSSNVIVLSN